MSNPRNLAVRILALLALTIGLLATAFVLDAHAQEGACYVERVRPGPGSSVGTPYREEVPCLPPQDGDTPWDGQPVQVGTLPTEAPANTRPGPDPASAPVLDPEPMSGLELALRTIALGATAGVAVYATAAAVRDRRQAVK